MRVGVALALLSACKSAKPHAAATRDDATVAVRDAAPADAGAWPELATAPTIAPVRVIAIPAKLDQPRFTIGGPVLLGDLALVSSSQFGFAAVDFRRGQLAWTKPAGSHVAVPVVVDGKAVLIGSCINPPTIPDDQTLLGCMRIVTPTGADQAYIAIRGGKAVDAFASSAGEQTVWTDQGAVMWRRGEQAIAIDVLSGVARPVPAEDPPLVVTYKTKQWTIRRTEDGEISATGTPSWKTESSYGPLIGAVYIPDQAPMVRVAQPSRHEGRPEIMLFDIDATGSLNGQVTMNPVPGIGIIGHAISKVGNAALAVRLDTSLERDYIAGYAANAALQWTYPLPQQARPDPVGLAITHDAVVVFHDGDTLTVLPELSAPPTAPGAVRDPLENATP
jgi:hypothetical protein